MTMQIRDLRLSAVTPEGRYGRHLKFTNGLNVIRAENASGKSTCTQALIYALGLESMLSARHEVPLPHSMKEWLQTEDGRRLDVLESAVFAELENGKGERLALRRTVKGGQDTHLITVWHGPQISNPEATLESSGYFVRQPGAATRERGFHKLLTDFIGLDLPDVQKFEGGLTQLYLECIFPLLLVEQKKGWSGIQAATPPQFQIRDVRKRAIEFVLGLDSHAIAQARLQIEAEKTEAKRAWSSVVMRLKEKASLVNGKFSDLPTEPISAWPPEVAPSLWRQHKEGATLMEEVLKALQDQLFEIEHSRIPSVQQDAERLNALLRSRTEDLAGLMIAISSLEQEVSNDGEDEKRLVAQISNLADDISHHNDLLRLRKMGSTEALRIASGHCPTCSQSIQDVLLPQADEYNALSVEESLTYLRGQRATFQAMHSAVKASIADKSKRLDVYRDTAAQIRSEIRTIKASLVTDARLPSEAAIEQKVAIRSEITKIQTILDESRSTMSELSSMSVVWNDILTRESGLSSGAVSNRDKEKLSFLRDSVCEQLLKYDLKSFDPSEFGISLENYLPIYGNYDLSFELSASDLIRLIWGYLIGLAETARNFTTNHPGFLFFDEPQQQNVKDLSFQALLDRASAASQFNQQIVIALSKLPDELKDEKNRKFNLLDISGKWMLQPESA